MNKIDEILALLKKKEREEEEECNCKRVFVTVLAVIGAIVAVAGIAYAVYRFLTPDYLEDFEEDFEEDDFEDCFEEE